MFWDRVAVVYDVFVYVINRRTHQALKKMIAGLIGKQDTVLECACGTGMLSGVIAENCKSLTATDFSLKMLQKAEKNCAKFHNILFEYADINELKYPDHSFDKVVAANVIHLLDEPMKALNELDRVCKAGGTLIIPTYMNKSQKRESSTFVSVADKAGADFKRQFTPETYRQFFLDAGYQDVSVSLAQGRIPCAVAVMKKRSE